MKGNENSHLWQDRQVETLGSVCSKPQYGWTTSAAESGEIKLLRTTDITSGQIDWDSVPYCRDAPPDPEKYLLEDGDIVISRAGSVGMSHRVVAPERVVFASYLIRFRPKPCVDGKYLAYYLQSPAYWSLVRGSTAGIAVPNVNASKLAAFRIPLVPLPEQRRIVAEIEKQFTRLEAGVAALKRVQANLKRYRAAVLKAACEGRLVPIEANLARQEGRAYETGEQLLIRILTERRRKGQGRGKYKEPTAPDTTDLPPIPEGWIWATIVQLAAIEPNAITDGPFGSNLKTEHYTNYGPRVIRLQNIGEGYFTDEKAHISDAHFARLQKHRVFGNDLVIAGLGEKPPRACLIPPSLGPAIVKADCIRFKPHEDIVPKYMNVSLILTPFGSG